MPLIREQYGENVLSCSEKPRRNLFVYRPRGTYYVLCIGIIFCLVIVGMKYSAKPPKSLPPDNVSISGNLSYFFFFVKFISIFIYISIYIHIHLLCGNTYILFDVKHHNKITTLSENQAILLKLLECIPYINFSFNFKSSLSLSGRVV